jgi:hypothetical protein
MPRGLSPQRTGVGRKATGAHRGTWSLEAVGRGGAWRFKLFDAVSGQQLGSTWRGLEVWVYAVTTARAASSLARMEQLYAIRDGGLRGYRPYSALDNWTPAYGEPYPTPTLWFEGSFGAVLATRRLGGNWEALHAGLGEAQLADGSFRYATVADAANDLATHRSVASVAWFLFNEVPGTRVWNERR